MNNSLSPFAPENLVSRDGFGSLVPRQPAHLHTQAESGTYSYIGVLQISAAASIYLFKPPNTIGSVPSLSGPATAYRWRSLMPESAGTGPVKLKVVSDECYLGRSPWTN